MKLYLSGPMSGLPGNNSAAFNEAASALRCAGHAVFNPAENTPRPDSCSDCAHTHVPSFKEPCASCTEAWKFELLRPAFQPALDDFSYYMAIDLPEVCKAEAVVFLPGWAGSKGACLEHHVAVQCGKKLFAYNEATLLSDL